MIKDFSFLVLYLFSFGLTASAFFLKLTFFLKDRNNIWKRNLLILIGFMAALSFFTIASFYVNLTAQSRAASVLIAVLDILQALFFSLLFPVVPYAFAALLNLKLRPLSWLWMGFSALFFFSGYLYSIFSGDSLILLLVIKLYLLAYLYLFLFRSLHRLSALSNRRLQRSVQKVLVLSAILLPPVTFEKWLIPAWFVNPILTGFEVPFLSIYIISLALIDIFYLVPALSGGDAATGVEGISERIFNQFSITGREKEIILMAQKGCTARETASKLGISLNTVNNHLANIYRKTTSSNKTGMLQKLRQASKDG